MFLGIRKYKNMNTSMCGTKIKFNDKNIYIFFGNYSCPEVTNIGIAVNENDVLLCKVKYLDKLYFYSFNTKTWYPFIENVEEFLHD